MLVTDRSLGAFAASSGVGQPGVAMKTCKVCGDPTEEGELCPQCTAKLGLSPGEPVRRASPCARCNHPELIRALVRELGNTDNLVRTTFPMAVTYGTTVTASVWTGRVTGVVGANESAPFGILEMYVCARCGFCEWYCRDPENIPIGPEFGTQKVRVGGDTPYR
jgi:hypothetical protein